MQYTNTDDGNVKESSLEKDKFHNKGCESSLIEQLIENMRTPLTTDEKDTSLLTNVANDGSIDTIRSKLYEVPDGGYGWMVVFSSFMVHSIIGGIGRSSGLLYLKFIDKYNQSSAATAWLCAIASCLRLMLGPLTGALSNRFSCRAVVMWGGVMICISMVISGFSSTLHFQFFSFGILGGIGRSFVYCPAVVIVGLYFNEKRGKAVGIATSGVGVGSFVIPPLIEVVFKHYGFVGAFIIIGGFTLNLTVFGILMRPLSVHKRIEAIQKRKMEQLISGNVYMTTLKRQDNVFRSKDFIIPVPREQLIKTHSFSKLKRRISSALSFSKSKHEAIQKEKKTLFEFSLLTDLRFTCFCIAILFFTLAFHSAYVFLPPYVKEIGGSDTEAALSVVVIGVCDGVGRICSGLVMDFKKIKPYRLYIYNGIMFIVGGICIIIPAITSFLQLAVLCGLYGILIGVYMSQKSVIIVDLLGPEKLHFSFGIMILFQGLGTLIGPTVGGVLKDINGTYDYAFYFGGVALLAGAFILLSANLIHWIRFKK